MKLFLILFFLIFNTCVGKKASKQVDQANYSKKNIKKTALNPYFKNQDSTLIKSIYDSFLIGMESSSESKEAEAYKKYSVDFTAACYSSNLLKIKVQKEHILISNYHNSKIHKLFSINHIKALKDSIFINCDSINFTIVKINDAPVYSLNYKGNINIDVHMSPFLVKEVDIEKFGGMDCGDFDG